MYYLYLSGDNVRTGLGGESFQKCEVEQETIHLIAIVDMFQEIDGSVILERLNKIIEPHLWREGTPWKNTIITQTSQLKKQPEPLWL